MGNMNTQTVDAALRVADRVLANEKIESDYILDDEVITLAAAVRALREELQGTKREVEWQTAVNKELMKSQESLARDLIKCRESKNERV